MSQDKRLPVAHYVQATPQGSELVLSLYTRGCRFAACSFCALPSLSSGQEAVSVDDVKAQIDHVFKDLSPQTLAGVQRLSVYNAGSVLDQQTLPSEALWHLFGRLKELPSLKLVALDTRAEYVEEWELAGMLERLEAVKLELAVGYETQDERIRNQVLRKGLSEESFRRLGALLASKGVRLKAYVLVKPDPAMSEAEGVEEAVKTLQKLAALGKELRLGVSVHLNPTYVAKGSLLEKEFRAKSYEPPRLWSVVDILLKTEAAGLPVQVGLHTEGLAVRKGSFHNCGKCDEAVRKALKTFSGTQDYGLLKDLSCECRK
ncbi:MAG TPA: hypothetical protein DCM05_16365 [Elusimicrobia bacterium]|nr:hypothetical protein [Elusimicrobiota bacterium]